MMQIILIHGAWQGSWVWADVVPCLNKAGHSCHAVDLPGSAPDIADRANVTFRDQVKYLEDLIAEIGEPVVVVAHSGGGLAASQIAENLPDRVWNTKPIALKDKPMAEDLTTGKLFR
jgi:pimeloyl-ACP methyl ester carboxylesterase